MRLDGALDIYNAASVPDPSGENITNWSLVFLKTIPAGIQPKVLSPVDLQQFGITDLTSNAKQVFCNIDPDIVELQHAQDQKSGKWYEIRAINTWPAHMEFVLTPQQGGQI